MSDILLVGDIIHPVIDAVQVVHYSRFSLFQIHSNHVSVQVIILFNAVHTHALLYRFIVCAHSDRTLHSYFSEFAGRLWLGFTIAKRRKHFLSRNMRCTVR